MRASEIRSWLAHKVLAADELDHQMTEHIVRVFQLLEQNEYASHKGACLAEAQREAAELRTTIHARASSAVRERGIRQAVQAISQPEEGPIPVWADEPA